MSEFDLGRVKFLSQALRVKLPRLSFSVKGMDSVKNKTCCAVEGT